jgi:D-lactate dehydrogenase
MKVLIFSAKPFEISLLKQANENTHKLDFTEKRLTLLTAMMAVNYDAISIFSADDASAIVLEKLHDFGVKYITLRSAGYDNVNIKAAHKLGLKVANTPNYSPNAIAEHAIALFFSYNRKIVLAHKQAIRNNFLLDNLIGFDLHNKTVGVLGTGRIGRVLVKILNGFGCEIQANDTSSNEQLVKDYNVEYVSKDAIAKEADIIFICLPLTSSTHYLFDKTYINKLKNKPIIINVARGAIVNTEEILKGLDKNLIGGYATDVYEREHGVFFYDRSYDVPKDPTLQKLLSHSKTLVTPHQAFATNEALLNIASATLENLNAWENGKHSVNELS